MLSGISLTEKNKYMISYVESEKQNKQTNKIDGPNPFSRRSDWMIKCQKLQFGR